MRPIKMENKLKEMTMKEIQAEQIRNLKLINLCLDIPVNYQSSINLDESKKDFYKKCGNYAQILKNMVVDDIKIELVFLLLKLKFVVGVGP